MDFLLSYQGDQLPSDANKDPIALFRRLKIFWLFFFTSEVTAFLL